MTIGLIRDLAVGCAQDGNEFLQNECLFIKNVSIGAPLILGHQRDKIGDCLRWNLSH